MGSSYIQKIVLLACGSFNPITNMHLRMFELARDYLVKLGCFDVVRGVISPVHDSYGKKDLVESKHRIEMARLAIQNSGWIVVDSWEADQEKWTPTAESMRHFQAKANKEYSSVTSGESESTATIGETTTKRKRKSSSEEPSTTEPSKEKDCCVKLLCGADVLESFAVPNLWDPKHIEEIVGEHGIIVISREGSNPQRFIYESDVLTKHQQNIHIVTEWMTNDISATKIRRAIRRSESTRYLMQDSAINYIKEHKLYLSTDDDSTAGGSQGCYSAGNKGSKIFC